METYPRPSSSKPDRKTIEKNRRSQMKTLFARLNSLLPPHGPTCPQEHMPLPDQIDEATRYIKRLQAHLERLKEKKSSFTPTPKVEVHLTGDSALQVVLVTRADSRVAFTEAVRAIQDQGAEVVNASFSVRDDSTVFHTIHAKVEWSDSEVAIARISERLNRFCS